MVPLFNELFTAQGRLSRTATRVSLALATSMLVLAVLGAFTYDGWHRVAYVSAFLLISLGNALHAFGSILPEDRGGKLARQAMAPVAALMFLALGAALVFQFMP